MFRIDQGRRSFMKVGSLSLALSLAAAALSLAAPAFAHHSFAMFDNTKTITFQGTVKDFEWINPHAWISIMVPNQAGVPEEWSFEMGALGQLSASGLKPDTLKPGDKVTVRVHPMKNGSRGGQYMSMTLADGQVFGMGQRQAAPAAAKD
jgi:hypothetical protein